MKPVHPLAVWLEKQETKQLVFADQLKISESFLSQILSGKRRTSLSLAKLISEATRGDVTIEALAEFEEKKAAFEAAAEEAAA